MVLAPARRSGHLDQFRAAVAFGLGFQVLFRAALLPHPAVDGSLRAAVLTLRSALPLTAFVSYHLLNPTERAKKVFWDWRFLSLAGLLGAGCSASYLLTGMLLCAMQPPVLHHLLAVKFTWAQCPAMSSAGQLSELLCGKEGAILLMY